MTCLQIIGRLTRPILGLLVASTLFAAGCFSEISNEGQPLSSTPPNAPPSGIEVPKLPDNPFFIEFRVIVSAPGNDGFVECHGFQGAVQNNSTGDTVAVQNISALSANPNPLGQYSTQFPINADGSFNSGTTPTRCVQGVPGDWITFTIFRNGISTDVSMAKRVNYYSKKPVIHTMRASQDPNFIYVGSDQGAYLCSTYSDRLDDCQHLTTASGLASNKVRSLTITPDGTLWVGTTNGLTRYLTSGSVSYFAIDGLPSSSITDLYVNGGQLWIGTQGGLALYENDSITNYSNLIGDQIKQMLPGPNGSVWVSHDGQGIYRLTGRSASAYSLEPVADCVDTSLANNVINMVSAHDDSLWVGTGTGSFRFDPTSGQFTKVKVSPSDTDHCRQSSILGTSEFGQNMWLGRLGVAGLSYEILCFASSGTYAPYISGQGLLNLPSPTSQLIQTANGNMWVGASDGLHELILTGNQIQDLVTPETSNVSFLTHTDANRFWLASDAGLGRFDNGTLIPYTTQQGIPDNDVKQILPAPGGSVWMVTQTGVTRYQCTPPEDCGFFTLTKDAGDSDPLEVKKLVRTSDGKLWGIEGKSLRRFDTDHDIFAAREFPTTFTISIAVAGADGTMWIGTDGEGLYQDTFEPSPPHYLPGSGPCTTMPSNRVRTLFRTQDGSIWVGTPSGLMRISWIAAGASPTCDLYNTQNVLSSNTINQIAQAPDQTVWVGVSNGLAHFRENGDYLATIPLQGSVRSFIVASDNTVWAALTSGATNAGLVHVPSSGNPWYCNDSNGLPNRNVTTIAEANNGYIWVGTAGQSSDSAAGIAVLDGHQVRTIYSTDSGLPDNRVTTLKNLEFNPTNLQIWAGTRGGLAVFYLE